MSMLLAIIGALLAFFIVVVVHEYGHYIVARWVGVKVLRFSIGFGKPIYKRLGKNGVEYVIGCLPLGGYVKMQDAFSDADPAIGSTGVAFEQKSLLARAAVVIAGPLMNFILAIILFFTLYVIGVNQLKPIVSRVTPNSIAANAHLKYGDQIVQMGNWTTLNWQGVVMQLVMHVGDKQPLPVRVQPTNSRETFLRQMNLQHWKFDPTNPNLLNSIGITPYFPAIPPVIGKIAPHSPASKSALHVNDKIISMGSQHVDSWQEVVRWTEEHPHERAHAVVSRDGHLKRIRIDVGTHHVNGRWTGFLGMTPKAFALPDQFKAENHYDFFHAFLPAIEQTMRLIEFHLVIIKQMILGHISLKALSGPATIFEMAGSAFLAGVVAYLELIAFISVVLGVINVLPIPALDGGHLLFFMIEALIRRPLPLRLQIVLINIGVVFLIGLMLYATGNDVIRLLS